MPEDIKSLTKKCADLEKRLKLAEAKIKALADNMTDAKDIEKYLSVIRKEQTDSEKNLKREIELQKKQANAEVEKAKKDSEKAIKDVNKQVEKMNLEARLIRLEAMVAAAMAKR